MKLLMDLNEKISCQLVFRSAAKEMSTWTIFILFTLPRINLLIFFFTDWIDSFLIFTFEILFLETRR